MLFKGNSSRLELLIGKIQAHKEPSQEEQHKSKGIVPFHILLKYKYIYFYFYNIKKKRTRNNLVVKLHDFFIATVQ